MFKPPFENSFLSFDETNKTIISAGKNFKVRLMTYEPDIANDFMTRNPETAVIDTDETGLHWIANVEAEEDKA